MDAIREGMRYLDLVYLSCVRGLKDLDVTQASIVGMRKQIVECACDPRDIISAFSHQWKYVESAHLKVTLPRAVHHYMSHLALFYLFNDIVQYSARSHIHGYLEHGANVFLPEVRVIVQIEPICSGECFSLKNVCERESALPTHSTCLGRETCVFHVLRVPLEECVGFEYDGRCAPSGKSEGRPMSPTRRYAYE